MRIRVSDYIADFLADNGITDVFTIVGGGAMHLNDALGHNPRLHCTYNHHEQACAIAAECYARINNRIAAVCVTTGPGGTNAITGVVGGWLDSIPMLVISGQVRYDVTARKTGLGIRAFGDQEFDITRSVECMTKYAEMIVDPMDIRKCLEKALHMATTGRPGPCWLDVPLDVQGAMVETDLLQPYDPSEYDGTLPGPVDDATADEILERIAKASRPVLYAGNGVRISGGYPEFLELVERLNIPVVTTFASVDLIPSGHPLYVGRAGNMGDRAGNFAVQNSDLVVAVGNRLSIREVGYNWATWARAAYVIMEDVDAEELRKPSIHVDMPVHADAKVFMRALLERSDGRVFDGEGWISRCIGWRERYPVVTDAQYAQQGLANVYCFIKELSRRLGRGHITVAGNGSACVAGTQAYVIAEGQRFIVNSAIASMGYDLPAAVGACIAAGRADMVCLSGDGSIQMNLQELQTIVTNRLPIKIFVISNEGYHSIRQTQTNMFHSNFCGIDGENGDLGFPDLSKLAAAYGYPYHAIRSNSEMGVIDDVLAEEGYAICEVFVDKKQFFEPKSSTKRLPDGRLLSPPLEDLSPFLGDEELKDNMCIDLVGEK